jgi:succinyl-CoA synthetase beta subunit
VEIGKKILGDSGMAIIPAETMAEAAEKIVSAVRSKE